MERHCHCHLHAQIRKLKAGKLGILGGILIVGHLLFHVAECLVLPAVMMALQGNTAEAAEVSAEDITELTATQDLTFSHDFQMSFTESLQKYPLQPNSVSAGALAR